MLELNVEKNGKCYIATATHLPSSILVKFSASSENMAIALCCEEIIKETSKIDWLCIKVNGENAMTISLNNALMFNVSGLSGLALDEIIECALGQFKSHHVFSYESEKYWSYCYEKSSNLTKLCKLLFLKDGVVIDVS